jgi:hypothetical protein
MPSLYIKKTMAGKNKIKIKQLPKEIQLVELTTKKPINKIDKYIILIVIILIIYNYYLNTN